MKALTRSGFIAGVSTRDVSGWVTTRERNIIDVGLAGSGYRVYTNWGRGAVNFGTAGASLSTNARHWRATGLSFPGDWRFVVRAFNEAGSELNLDRGVELRLDETGKEEPRRPTGVTSLAGRAAAGGKVELSFTHDGVGEEAETTHFHVYHDGGSGTIDYATIRAEITRAQGRVVHHVYVSPALEGEKAYRFAVRSASAEDIEDEGKATVEVSTDATAPTQPEELSGRVIH